MPTFWKRLDEFPPILIRLLAREGPNGPPLGTTGIVFRTGLSHWQVEQLSLSTSWDGVPVNTVKLFCQGCGIDLASSEDIKRITVYLRGKVITGHRVPPNFKYLRQSDRFRDYYKPLMELYFKSLKT